MPKVNNEKLAALLASYLKENDLTLREFAEIANLSHAYIDRLSKGKNPQTGKIIEPTMLTLQQLAVAMNMSLVDLLVKCDYLKEVDREMVAEIPTEYIRFIDKAHKEKISPETLEQILNSILKLKDS